MSDAAQPEARLALADGTVFRGRAFGDTSSRCVDGEVCFNTSLTGYQEILTDPSYAGQIVTMTCPLIGNYGVNETDMESRGVFARGFVVRELARRVSNHRAEASLDAWLARLGVTGVTGIDTRALTRKLRITGAMNGILSTGQESDADLVDRARRCPGLEGRNLAKEVAISEPMPWTAGLEGWAPIQGAAPDTSEPHHVVAIDCGAKQNILRNLVDCGFRLTVVPFDTTADAIAALQPDGVFVSNGPGDPAAVSATIETIRGLRGKFPLFGICLGHQLIALALGATTYKLKFGHRGGNQPVQNVHTRKVEITSQNHGFAVDTSSLEACGGETTHINLNDQTLEGFRHKNDPIFAVQYHPEASPGPHDARYLFDCFGAMMATGRSPSGAQMDDAQRRRNKVHA